MSAPRAFRVVPGTDPPPVDPDDPGPQDQDAPPAADETPVVASSWLPVDLGPALRGDAPQVVPTILSRSDGVRLFYPGKLNLSLGESESCKTWAAFAACAETLDAGGTVVWLDLEDDATTSVLRLRALGVPDEVINARFVYLRPDTKLGLLEAKGLRQLVTDRAVRLVVVDSMNEFMALQGWDPKSDIDVVQTHSLLREVFTKPGAAVNILDHVVKDKDSRGRWASGSERKISGIDGAAYTFEVVAPFAPGLTGRVRIAVSKDRPGRVRAEAGGPRRDKVGVLELVSHADGRVRWSLQREAEAAPGGVFRPTGQMAKVTEALRQSNGPMSTNAIRLAVGGKHAYVDLALELLVNEGYVKLSTGPRNAKTFTYLRTFKDAP